MCQMPDNLSDDIKDLLNRKDSISEDEFNAELELLVKDSTYYCSTKCKRSDCNYMCLLTLLHDGKHYCPKHSWF